MSIRALQKNLHLSEKTSSALLLFVHQLRRNSFQKLLRIYWMDNEMILKAVPK